MLCRNERSAKGAGTFVRRAFGVKGVRHEQWNANFEGGFKTAGAYVCGIGQILNPVTLPFRDTVAKA
jgi:hypothetical protein